MQEQRKQPVLMVGDGGLARVLADQVQLSDRWKVVGFVGQGQGTISGLPRYDARQPQSVPQGIPLVLAMLRPNYRESSVALFGPSRFITLDHGFVSPSASIGHGTVIMKDSYVNSRSKIGHYVHVHLSAIVGHDCTVGDFSFIGPGCILGGYTRVGKRCRLGMRAVVLPKVIIGDEATVAAGSVVTQNVEPGTVVAGNPARPVSKTNFDRF